MDSRTRLAEMALLLLPRVGQLWEGRQGGRSARTVAHQKDLWRDECRVAEGDHPSERSSKAVKRGDQGGRRGA